MIAVKFIQDKSEYREWDIIPRITIVFEKSDFLGIGIGWLIWGVVIATRPETILRRIKKKL